MGNPSSSLTFGIPFACYDGKFRSQYPQGEYPLPTPTGYALGSPSTSTLTGTIAALPAWVQRVEWSRSPAGQNSWTVVELPASATFIYVGLQASLNYDTRVRYKYANTYSDYSAVANLATSPLAPTNPPVAPTLTGPTRIDATTLQVGISNAGSGADSWLAQIRTPAGSGTWQAYGAVTLGVTTFNFTVPPTGQHELRIVAHNDGGDTNSNAVSGTALLQAPTLASPAVSGSTATVAFSGGSFSTLIPKYRLVGAGAWTTLSSDVISPLTYSGLAAGNYEFEVWPDGNQAYASNRVTGTVVSGGASAAFSDGFESGGFASAQNGIAWGDSNYGGADLVQVNNSLAYAGAYSMLLRHGGGASGDDSWAEKRMTIATPVSEIWIKYAFFVPSNYIHRNDSPGNNKFLAVYANPYTSPGFQVNWSTDRLSNTSSRLIMHIYHNGSEQTPLAAAGSAAFIGPSDIDRWMELVFHVKVPTSSGAANGVMEVYKNGVLFDSHTGLNIFGSASRNYINEIYYLGWANSGFTSTTDFRIDSVEVAYSNIWGV